MSARNEVQMHSEFSVEFFKLLNNPDDKHRQTKHWMRLQGLTRNGGRTSAFQKGRKLNAEKINFRTTTRGEQHENESAKNRRAEGGN